MHRAAFDRLLPYASEYSCSAKSMLLHRHRPVGASHAGRPERQRLATLPAGRWLTILRLAGKASIPRRPVASTSGLTMWRIHFTSDRFLPSLPEECQTNPGAYGFELALWLAHQLLGKGIVTSYPQSEDWGWFIEFTDDAETEIQIGCGSLSSHGDGYTGRPVEWSVFIKPHTSLRERLTGVTHSEKVNRLGDQVVELLKSVGALPRLEPA